MSNENGLYHSDTYLGEDFTDGIKHWKYIRKERKNGRWVYYYDESEMNKEKEFVQKLKYDAMKKTANDFNKYKGTKQSEKTKRAVNTYNTWAKKYNRQYITDIPKRVISKGAVKVANILSKLSSTLKKKLYNKEAKLTSHKITGVGTVKVKKKK